MGRLGIAYKISGEASEEQIEHEKKRILQSIILSILGLDLIHFEVSKDNNDTLVSGYLFTENKEIEPTNTWYLRVMKNYPFIHKITE